MAGCRGFAQETAMPHTRRAPHPPLQHIQRVRRRLADGRYNIHHYYRRRTTRAKLPGKPHSPEYLAVYWECERQLTAARLAKSPILILPQNCRRIFSDGSCLCISEDGCLIAGDV
jgi:hypothetical protein